MLRFFTLLLLSTTLAFGQGQPSLRFLTTTDLVAYNIPSVHGNLTAFVGGDNTLNLGTNGGVFFYDVASTLATNTTKVYKPNNSGGRWLRILQNFDVTAISINGSDVASNLAQLYTNGLNFTNIIGSNFVKNLNGYSTNQTATNLFIDGFRYATDTNTVTVHQSGNDVYFSTPWTNNNRLEWHLTWTNTVNPTTIFGMHSINIVSNNTPTNHTVVSSVSTATDDLPPILTSFASYIDGDHGWFLSKVTLASHGFNVGDKLYDAGTGFNFAIIRVDDANTFWIVDNIPSSPNHTMTGAATNLTKSVALTGYSNVNALFFPSVLTNAQTITVDGNSFATNSFAYGHEIDFTSTHTIWDARQAYSFAVNNPSFALSDVPPIFQRTMILKFLPQGQMTCDDTLTSTVSTNWTLLNHGGMQVLPDSLSATYMVIPNAAPQLGVTPSIPFAISSAASGVLITNQSDNMINPGRGINTSFLIQSNAGWGQILSYDPYAGNSAWNRSSTTLWWLNPSSGKIYPYSSVGNVVTSGTVDRVVAHRRVFPFTGQNEISLNRGYDAAIPFYSTQIGFNDATSTSIGLTNGQTGAVRFNTSSTSAGTWSFAGDSLLNSFALTLTNVNYNSNSMQFRLFGYSDAVGPITGPALQKIAIASSQGAGDLAVIQHQPGNYTNQFQVVTISPYGDIGAVSSHITNGITSSNLVVSSGSSGATDSTIRLGTAIRDWALTANGSPYKFHLDYIGTDAPLADILSSDTTGTVAVRNMRVTNSITASNVVISAGASGALSARLSMGTTIRNWETVVDSSPYNWHLDYVGSDAPLANIISSDVAGNVTIRNTLRVTNAITGNLIGNASNATNWNGLATNVLTTNLLTVSAGALGSLSSTIDIGTRLRNWNLIVDPSPYRIHLDYAGTDAPVTNVWSADVGGTISMRGLIATNAIVSNLTNNALTASQLTATDANKKMVSVAYGLGITNNGSVLSNNIVAGSNVTITGGANGQLTIAATGSAPNTGAGVTNTGGIYSASLSAGSNITLSTNAGGVIGIASTGSGITIAAGTDILLVTNSTVITVCANTNQVIGPAFPYTILKTDSLLIDGAGGGDWRLPAITSDIVGKTYTFKALKGTVTPGTLKADTGGPDLIDGAATVTAVDGASYIIEALPVAYHTWVIKAKN